MCPLSLPVSFVHLLGFATYINHSITTPKPAPTALPTIKS